MATCTELYIDTLGGLDLDGSTDKNLPYFVVENLATLRTKPMYTLVSYNSAIHANLTASETPGFQLLPRSWTNNNRESVNHVLKQAIDWKAQPLTDLLSLYS